MIVLEELRSLLRLYAQQFKTTFASMVQYRASLFIWMIAQVLEPLVYLIVWSTVSNGSGDSVGGYTAQGFAGYYLAFMLVNQTGSLVTMLAAPTAFEWIGVAPAVVVCGGAIVVVGLIGMRRFGTLTATG